MLYWNILSVGSILLSILRLGREPDELAGELDVLGLSLVHLNAYNIFNSSLDVEFLDDLYELASLELCVPQNVFYVQQE